MQIPGTGEIGKGIRKPFAERCWILARDTTKQCRAPWNPSDGKWRRDKKLDGGIHFDRNEPGAKAAGLGKTDHRRIRADNRQYPRWRLQRQPNRRSGIIGYSLVPADHFLLDYHPKCS